MSGARFSRLASADWAGVMRLAGCQEGRRASRDPDRDQSALAMRNSGMTLQQIGVELGISREAVRQKLKKRFGLSGYLPHPPAPQRWPIKGFGLRMRQWLWECGYRKCGACQIWSDEPTRVSRLCRECGRKKSRAHYNTPEGKQKALQYRKDHPEENRRSVARYLQKLKATEEGREKLRKRNRESEKRRYWAKKAASTEVSQ